MNKNSDDRTLSMLSKIEQLSPRRVEDFGDVEETTASYTVVGKKQKQIRPLPGDKNTEFAATVPLPQECMTEDLVAVVPRMLQLSDCGDGDENSHWLSWSEQEDDLLKVAVKEMGSFHNPPWIDISNECFLGLRSPFECQDRWDAFVSPVNFHLVMVRGKPEMRRFPTEKVDCTVESSSSASGDDGHICFDLLFWGMK